MKRLFAATWFKRLALALGLFVALPIGVLIAAAPLINWNSIATALPSLMCFDTGNSANPFQCQAVNASNPLPITGTATVSGNVTVVQPTASALNATVVGTGTFAVQDATVATNTGTTNTDIGPPGATACATDTGSCSINALEQRIAQRVTSLITALGTPMQTTGGTVGLVASQNGVGNVGGKTVSVCTTPTVTASNAYGTNYVVGGKLTFANAFTSTGSGILQGVVVTILDTETSGFTFFPFATNPTNSTWTDAAVAAIAAGDVPFVRGPIALSQNNQLKSTAFTVASAAGIGEALAPGTTSLYGVLIANAALTNNFAGTSDVQVCVKVLQDL